MCQRKLSNHWQPQKLFRNPNSSSQFNFQNQKTKKIKKIQEQYEHSNPKFIEAFPSITHFRICPFQQHNNSSRFAYNNNITNQIQQKKRIKERKARESEPDLT